MPEELESDASQIASTWGTMTGSSGEYVRLSSFVINSQALVRNLTPLLGQGQQRRKRPGL